MTFSELNRALLSKQRIDRIKAQEKATYDYILAALIGRNVSAYFGENITIPEITEVYGALFEEQAKENNEKKTEKKAELSVLRFKQFVKAYNDNHKKS